MRIGFLLFSLLIICRVDASVYPATFPTTDCETYFNEKNISSNYYDDHLPYKIYYHSLNRKNCYKEWTLLVFMAADNDLSPYAYWDIYEMERLLSGQNNLGATTDSVDVIVELDTLGKNGVNRYHIFQTNQIYDPSVDLDFFSSFNESNINSPIIKKYLEQNNTVKDQNIRFARFITQSMRDYPSKHYMVVIWGHGEGYIGSHYKTKSANPNQLPSPSNGNYLNPANITVEALNHQYNLKAKKKFPYNKVFGGVAFDYTDISFLDIPSIQQTIKKTLSQLQYNKPIDIIAFDACLMQTLEVATELADITDYVIGSTQIQNYLGLPYKMILDKLNEKISPFDLARRIPSLVSLSMDKDGYQGLMSVTNKGTFTTSTLSTHTLKKYFIPSFMEFSQSLIDYIEEDLFRLLDLKVIFENSPSFKGETRDIGILLAAIEQLLYAEKKCDKETLKGIHLKNQILKLWDNLNQMVLGNSFGPYYTDSSLSEKDTYFLNYFKGFSLWVPTNKKLYDHRIEEFRKSALYTNYQNKNSISPFEKLLNIIYNTSMY